jgi:two-component system chemotaxis response regulator CheB
MREAGARTFGQDENSCVVYGMPREAARIGAVEEVVPIEEMAGRVLLALGRS